MDCSTPCQPVPHHLPEFAQVTVNCTSIPIDPCHPLSPSSPSVFNLCQHQSGFQCVSCSHQVAKVLEFQHQSFQWVFRTDFLQDELVGSPCSPRDSQSLLQHHSWKASILWCSSFFMAQLSQPDMTTGRITALTNRALLAKWCLCFLTHCLGLS